MNTNANYFLNPLIRGIDREQNGLLDPRPAPGSPAFAGPNNVPQDGFFTPANYKGGLNEILWYADWSALTDNHHSVPARQALIAPPPTSAECLITLSSTGVNYELQGGSGSFGVTDVADCGYTATTTNSWIMITGGSPGSGAGTITFTVAPNLDSVVRTGVIQVGDKVFTITQEATGWFTDPVFGVGWYAGYGWFGHNAYGWMWDDPDSDWIWSSTLANWIARMGASRTLWSVQFRWLTPSETDPYYADTTSIGPIYIGQYQGTTVPDSWVVSPRFGYIWANGDGVWFYSDSHGWLGVTPEGDIWSVNEGRFL